MFAKTLREGLIECSESTKKPAAARRSLKPFQSIFGAATRPLYFKNVGEWVSRWVGESSKNLLNDWWSLLALLSMGVERDWSVWYLLKCGVGGWEIIMILDEWMNACLLTCLQVSVHSLTHSLTYSRITLACVYRSSSTNWLPRIIQSVPTIKTASFHQ